jgi:hypothetical protein
MTDDITEEFFNRHADNDILTYLSHPLVSAQKPE